MKTLKLTATPTTKQKEIANQHRTLADDFLYDINGTTVYAVCVDGLVCITEKIPYNFTATFNQN